MTDDIVTRLRRVPERVPKGMGLVGLNEYYQRCQDAADEIERLRAEVKLLQEQEKRLNLQILANFKSIDAMHKELYGEQ